MSTSKFNADDTKRLIELYEERREVLQGTDKKCGAEASRKKQWEKVQTILNSETGKKFAIKQIKKRWQNVKSRAKEAYVSSKRGTPQEKRPLSETEMAEGNIEKGKSIFCGISAGEECFVEEHKEQITTSFTEILHADEENKVEGSSSVHLDNDITSAPQKKFHNHETVKPATTNVPSSDELKTLQFAALSKQLEVANMQLKREEIALQNQKTLAEILPYMKLICDVISGNYQFNDALD